MQVNPGYQLVYLKLNFRVFAFFFVCFCALFARLCATNWSPNFSNISEMWVQGTDLDPSELHLTNPKQLNRNPVAVENKKKLEIHKKQRMQKSKVRTEIWGAKQEFRYEQGEGAEIKGTMDGSGILYIYIYMYIYIIHKQQNNQKKKQKTSCCWLKHASISRFPYTQKHPSMTLTILSLVSHTGTLAAHANLGVLGSSSPLLAENIWICETTRMSLYWFNNVLYQVSSPPLYPCFYSLREKKTGQSNTTFWKSPSF